MWREDRLFSRLLFYPVIPDLMAVWVYLYLTSKRSRIHAITYVVAATMNTA